MKNVMLAIVGLACAMGFTSGDAESKKEVAKEQLAVKQTLLEKEKHQRRW